MAGLIPFRWSMSPLLLAGRFPVTAAATGFRCLGRNCRRLRGSLVVVSDVALVSVACGAFRPVPRVIPADVPEKAEIEAGARSAALPVLIR